MAQNKFIFKIHTIKQVPDEHGNHFVISRVGVYHPETGKWIKWAKLNDFTLSLLKNAQIHADITTVSE